MNRTPAPLLVAVALVAAVPAFSFGAQSGPKLYFDACPGFGPGHAWDHYHDFAEVTAFLQAAAAAHPEVASLQSIGKSWQGRDLWVLTLTDRAGGEPGTKPAVWVDGGVDADEVIAIEGALHLAWKLTAAADDEARDLLRRRTFYVAPAVIPDTSELHMTTPLRPRDSTQRPWDDDRDGRTDEDSPDDLNGDGQALQMRVLDPLGDRVVDEDDPRLLRPRRLGDEGPFYRVYPEAIDDDGDGRYGEDPPGGIDPNRNYPGGWMPEHVQGGAGPWAASEPELRAMLDFFLAHPDIAASQHLHSSGGVVLMPPSTPDLELPRQDFATYMEVARAGLEATGYELATNVYDWNWPRGSRNNKRGQVWRDRDGEIRGGLESGNAYPAYGGSIDTLYELFGALSFANEMFQLGRDDDGNGLISDLERLADDDANQDGAAFMEWTPFEHPQLGAVEIGGWRKFGQNNPLPPRLLDEVQRNYRFVLMQARVAQELVVQSIDAESLGSGLWRIAATVANAGFVPTELQIRRQRDMSDPVRVQLQLPAGARLIEPASDTAVIEFIPGYGAETVSWIVAADGGAVTVAASHPKAGRAMSSRELR